MKKAEISGLRYQNNNFHLRKSKVEVEKVERWRGVEVEGGKVYFSPGFGGGVQNISQNMTFFYASGFNVGVRYLIKNME